MSTHGKLKREGSLEFGDVNEKSTGTIPEDGDYPSSSNFQDGEDALNLPPGRLHSTRVKEKLSGSMGNLNIGPGSLSTSGSRSKSNLDGTRSPGGSRSHSPSMKDRASMTTTAAMGDSSISSLEDLVDADILYDRKGLIDDLSQSSSNVGSGRHNAQPLPSVNERLSEETLDDVHAFTDVVVRSSNASRTPSVGTDRELFLDPLDEIDEDAMDDAASLEDVSEANEAQQQQVILTNMEKISISDPPGEEASASAVAAALVRGSSSLAGEAPEGVHGS